MSRINALQNELRQLSDDAFQKLAEAYLFLRGFDSITPLGAVIGADKVRRGTPDAVIAIPGGKFIFAEFTTQQSQLCHKLKGDLEKCLNETKTGVPITSVEAIVVCHTGVLSAGEQHELRELCRQHGVDFYEFGVARICLDICYKYPELGREYLNVQVDTGQIVSLEEFVYMYDRNPLATPLDIRFHFREDEIGRVVQEMQHGSLVVLSGRPGVGKSRLALECALRFRSKFPEYTIKCVFNRGPDLFEDLRLSLSRPGKYLLVLDDANRINRFDYALQLLNEGQSNRTIKIIATVRDYALETIRRVAKQYAPGVEIEIEPLKDEEIKTILHQEFHIRHPRYLERISAISGGNPRLAIMAARVAQEKNTWESIRDVSALYDEYFTSLRQDLDDLGHPNLLSAACLVALFRHIDRTNLEQMAIVESLCQITADRFWDLARRLHDLEICDMYEDEVVKVSDQVVATYILFLALFRKGTIKLTSVMEHFFPRFKRQLVDALYPVIHAFHSEALLREIRYGIDLVWSRLECTGDVEGLLGLMETFWFAKRPETLRFIRDHVRAMPPSPLDPESMEIVENSSVPITSVLSVLRCYCRSSEDEIQMAIILLCEYLDRRPDQVSIVLHLLITNFGIRHDSYDQEFVMPRTVVNELWYRTSDGTNLLFSRLFIAVAEHYLKTSFRVFESTGEQISVISFDLVSTPELSELREVIWTRLFELCVVASHTKRILNLINRYSVARFDVGVGEIVREDARVVLPLLKSRLRPEEYEHCRIAQKYLNLLTDMDIPYDRDLKGMFTSDAQILSELILTEWKGADSYPEWSKNRGVRLVQFAIENHVGTDVVRLVQLFKEVFCASDSRDKHLVASAFSNLLERLAEENSHLFENLFVYYLTLGNPFHLPPGSLVDKLVHVCGSERAYDVLMEPNYVSRHHWLFCYFQILSAGQIGPGQKQELYRLYQDATPHDCPPSFDYLLPIRAHDEEVLEHVISTILTRTSVEPMAGRILAGLFHPHTEVFKHLPDLLGHDLDLMKRAYRAAITADSGTDPQCLGLSTIMDLDPWFIMEYADWMIGDPPLDIQSRDHSALWIRDEYEVTMARLVERIYDLQSQFDPFVGRLIFLFGAVTQRETRPLVVGRQDGVLSKLIGTHHHNRRFMGCIFFTVISTFSPERRRTLLSSFLRHNAKYEDFAQLQLEPWMWSYKRSVVPKLQERIGFWESLFPLLRGIEFLEHRQHVEEKIERLRSEVERERKRDFLND